MANLKTLVCERVFRTRICFYVTTEYNNARIMPGIFKETLCNKKICNTSNIWLNHEDFVISFFYDKKAKSQKKMKTKRVHVI